MKNVFDKNKYFYKFLIANIFLIAFSASEVFSQDYIPEILNHRIKNNFSDITEYSEFYRPLTGAENKNIRKNIFALPASTHKTLVGRKLFEENLIIQKDKEFIILIDPVLNFSYYFSNDNNNGYRNTRGAIIRGNLDSKIFFYSFLEESQAAYPFLETSLYNTYGIIPGLGRIKPLDGYNEFDFGNACGAISLLLNKNLNFTLGYDRLFLGNGYRSMILSDFSAPLFFFRTLVNIKNVEIGNIFTKTLNPNFNNILNLSDYSGENSRYPQKFISYNFIKFQTLRKLHLSLIQTSIISHDIHPLKIFAYNYTPLMNLLYFSTDSTQVNIMGGINVSWQDSKLGVFYSQFIADKQKSKIEYAFQLGYKNYNLLSTNIFFQLEYNFASPQMYQNIQNNNLHYGHFNMPLAHPAGNNISELVLIVSYAFRDFELLGKANFNFKLQNYNIFNNEIYLQRNPSKNYYDIQLIYNINKINRSQIFAGVIVKYKSSATDSMTWFNIGFRNAIRSNYYDF